MIKMSKSDDTIDLSGEDVFEVEKIVGVNRQSGKTPLYRVRWKGYGPEEDTYEPRDHLLSCEDMIDDYLANEKTKPKNDTGEKKKPTKRRHSGDSASPPDASDKKGSSTGKRSSPTPSNKGAGKDGGISGNDEVDPKTLLKDTFWDDLQSGAIPDGLFEDDMYSKVKSRRATLEAKRIKKKEERAVKTPGAETSQVRDKTSPPAVKDVTPEKKKKNPPEETGEGKKPKTKRHGSGGGGGDDKKQERSTKKKKKKKDHKTRKKHRRVKVDLDAIGSLESATQKSLRMSPSELEGSDNSANLFVSSKPAEEFLAVANLEEHSRPDSPNGSLSSDGGNDDQESPNKSEDTVLSGSSKDKDSSLVSPTNTDASKDKDGYLLSPTNTDGSNDLGFLGGDIENILEKDPFSMNEDTDSEAVAANLSPKTFQSVNESDAPMTGKDAPLPNFDPGPSLWDQFAKDLPPLPPSSSVASSSVANSVVSSQTFQSIRRLISGPEDEEAANGSSSLSEERAQGNDGPSTIRHEEAPDSGEPSTGGRPDVVPRVKQEPSDDAAGTNIRIKQEVGAETFRGSQETSVVVKQEPQERQESLNENRLPPLNGSSGKGKGGSNVQPGAPVVKQESLDIPESIEDHLTPGEPATDKVPDSQSLTASEELPNLTGNLFDSLIPANSPFTDDEQGKSDSEEPRIDVNKLLSSLEDKEQDEDDMAKEAGLEKKEVAEKDKNKEMDIDTRKDKNTEGENVNLQDTAIIPAASKTDLDNQDKLKEASSSVSERRTPLAESSRDSAKDMEQTINKTQKLNTGSGSESHSPLVSPISSDSLGKGSDTTALSTGDPVQRETSSKQKIDQNEVIAKKGELVESHNSEPKVKSDTRREIGKVDEDKTSIHDGTEEAVVVGNVPDENSEEGHEKDAVKKSGTSSETFVNSVPQSDGPLLNTNGEKGTSVSLENKGTTVTDAGDDSSAKAKPEAKPARRKSKGELKKDGTQVLSSDKTVPEMPAKTDAKTVSKRDVQDGGTVGEPPAKKPFKSTDKKKDTGKVKDALKGNKKARAAVGETSDAKALGKGTVKGVGGKDKEGNKKTSQDKVKLKKKISAGSWKFDCISEIPRSGETKLPMDELDKDEMIDEDYLCEAIGDGELGLVNAILHHNPALQVDRPNSRGQWPVVLACMGGHNAILKKLILSKAQVDVRLSNGVTPLMIAAEKGHTSAVGILLEAGASVNLANSSGETALIKASRRGHLDIVQLLLHYGADWGLTSMENISALSLAKQHKMYMVSDLLQKHEQKLVEQLEYGISKYMLGSAKLIHSVLPSRCFRIRESTQHNIKFNFDPTKIPFSPSLGTMLFLCHVSPGSSGMTCHLTGPCHVKEVTLNGTRTNPVPEGNGFVMEFIPKAGTNSLNITTHSDPYTKMLLLVAAYSLQLTQS